MPFLSNSRNVEFRGNPAYAFAVEKAAAMRLSSWTIAGIVLFSIGFAVSASPQEKLEPNVLCYLSNPAAGACAVFRAHNAPEDVDSIVGYIDGRVACTFSPSSYCAVPITAGQHEVQNWINYRTSQSDWCGPSLTVNIPAGMQGTVGCGWR